MGEQVIEPVGFPVSEGTVRAADGRKVAYATWGDAHGSPVIFLHGSPGSRLWPNEAATYRQSVRLITFDRPGYGLSDPDRALALVERARDIMLLADELELGQFALMGWSTGTQLTLAGAFLGSKRVSLVGLISPNRFPYDERAGSINSLPPERREQVVRARQDPKAFLAEAMRDPTWRDWEDPKEVFEAVRNSDPWVLEEPTRSFLQAHVKEGVRRGITGMVLDELLAHRSWGFALKEIATPVQIWHGEHDLIPLDRPSFLASTLPNATLEVWTGEGHCGVLRRWDQVLSVVRRT